MTDFQTIPRTEAWASRALQWRVIDIVVASVIGVASGLVFVLWNIASNPISAPLSALLPGVQGLVGGGWLFAGVLTALIIRKPGAALYGELLAASVSALIGNQWGALTLESGIVQGLGAELVFAIFLYKRWGLPIAILAGAASGLALAINDLILWYPGSATAFTVIYTVSAVISGAVVAGVLAWFVVKAIAKTGALNRFAAGRHVRR
ncbi:ECF transporter S component [Microbacterium azadirachtae]|uniref:Energy-coupling factor transport system substrate-specific component n=1 Tax=Microbacterium azadirachtae TaxID=582680 RepID=A0A1I6G8F9_9MICO|nr:ECF transporter S component [Microbacterium azadirachtae]SDL37520.1 energy-coupling factor transport system substrate-specific component [Microbacterium azadirachtae]SEF68435.1 energy-coupling factor transport system substrate-specific component [Microbacterium azadirachtae]SEF69119.1 energy-coupling factor transport system substrate-specific component [Microbacterium azadirachtae]SFR38486.1 energy-coupling factor transport system substrate-specific component [Microbacterium azadirachtae]